MSQSFEKKSSISSERTKLKNIALFKDDQWSQLGSSQQLALEKIVLPTSQPRRYFAPEKMEQLTLSIKEHGILEPLLVRPQIHQINESYELVAGERRLRAALSAGLTEVPVIIKELSDKEALQIALIENLHREDLNPIESTEGILQLIALSCELETEEVISTLYRMYNQVKGNITNPNPNVRVSELDESIKIIFSSLIGLNWQSFVKNKLPLLKLPEDILQVLRQGKIEYTKAKAIARLKNESKREALLKSAIEENWSLSKIKEKIAELENKKNQQELNKQTAIKKITQISQKLKKSKLWQSDPQKWQELEEMLQKIDLFLEQEEKKEDT